MDTISINGVTYYNLDDLYPGDITKHCSLNTEDLDQNFHVLRGHDIESVGVSGNTLILRRLNGSETTAELNENVPITSENLIFEYNSSNGNLLITYPDGGQAEITGFTTNIHTDNTLTGNGSQNDPLMLSKLEKTGTFSPANDYLILGNWETLPTEDVDVGYRIVTKETCNSTGALYNTNGFIIISDALRDSGSEWRIPSKEDWDKLLDSLEPENYVNPNLNIYPHSATTIGEYLGKYAAQHLKSELFSPNNTPIEEDSTCGYNTIGFNILPVGTASKEFDNSITYNGIYELSSFWTSTKTLNNIDYYTKDFYFNTNKVMQKSNRIDEFMSIRLVKDYNGNNYKGDEGIFGQTYPTILREDIGQIWTSINVYATKRQIPLLNFEENYVDARFINPNNNDICFYINEFDGTEWIKKELKEGDSIVILSTDNGENPYYKKWIVKGNELCSFEDYVNSQFESFRHDITLFIEDLANTLTEQINSINERLDYLDNNLETTIKNVVKNYIIGTENEIKITETEDEKLKIGFSDDAIFE